MRSALSTLPKRLTPYCKLGDNVHLPVIPGSQLAPEDPVVLARRAWLTVAGREGR